MKEKQKKKILLSLSFMTNSRHVDLKEHASDMQACAEKSAEKKCKEEELCMHIERLFDISLMRRMND
jgi:hypothetical protein